MFSRFSKLRVVPAFALSIVLFASQLIPIGLLGGLVLTQTACPGSRSIAKVAGEVVNGIDDALPIFRSNGQSTERLEQARTIAVEVQSAFASGGDTTKAVELTERLIQAFKQIQAEAEIISDPTKRTIVLVGLLLFNRALRNLADKLAEEAPAAVTSGPMRTARSVRTIADFRQEKKWRCRSSQTGRFAEMSYCKAHPDVSQVETY